MSDTIVQVRHVYSHEFKEFEAEVNDALRNLIEQHGIIGDIKYVIDPSTPQNQRGGFGALIIFETPKSSTSP